MMTKAIPNDTKIKRCIRQVASIILQKLDGINYILCILGIPTPAVELSPLSYLSVASSNLLLNV